MTSDNVLLNFFSVFNLVLVELVLLTGKQNALMKRKAKERWRHEFQEGYKSKHNKINGMETSSKKEEKKKCNFIEKKLFKIMFCFFLQLKELLRQKKKIDFTKK